MYPMLTAALFTLSQDTEATKMSIMRGVSEEVVHIHDGILFSHKKEQNNPICSSMDRPRDDHTI